uniref:zinc finger protein 721 isoform X1 n=1 Tax=Solea senegalensis TaxID=28829 RepID=UPI001CD91190|nr:zinc finger protein 721 isoform X1 [Solea senegalensis]
MDETSGAIATTVTIEDEAENNPSNGQKVLGNDAGPSTAEDSVNSGVEGFYTQHCGEVFREEAAYVEHHHQHPPEKVYLDDQLDDPHDAEKDRETANVCSLCSLSFAELSEFHLHMEKNHGQTSPKESGIQKNSEIKKQPTYECPDCGKSYYTLGHFLNHQRSHTQAAKSVFNDLEHLKKKPFQCELCGRNYSRASALDAHRRYHQENLVKSRNRNSGDTIPTEESIPEAKPHESQTDNSTEKSFECKCGKAFSAPMGLKTHQRFSRNSQCSREVANDKPKKINSKFYCTECDKDFGAYLALFNHQRWHSNHSQTSAKKFECEECGKSFVSSTFYFRHKRLKHSLETPAKSFLHQVCQLQKKAFECKDCGLKFSRASALHSHQLHHTDVYGDGERKEKENDEVKLDVRLPIASRPNEEASLVHEADEDVESYEPGDFIVQVISASESDDEPVHDLKPDLELLCESDQEMRDDGDTDASSSVLVVKPEMDLKIVQVDFEQADEHDALLASEGDAETAEQRFNCPECYRWFNRSGSLAIHRMWHRIRRTRQQCEAQSAAVGTSNTGGHDGSSSTVAPHCSHIQQHKTHNPSDDVLNQAEDLEKKILTCGECGQSFSHLSALVSHQLHHPKRKRFQCPDCMMSYLHAASLFNHMKKCSAQKKDNVLISKKEYNPKKTLLGPKIYHCEQCGKGFWSLGAYSHHKQNQNECAELRQRKGGGGSLHSVNGQPRSTAKVACPVCGRKFRHKGIMTLHMRKHENGNHKCELCPRSFRLFSSLLRHQVVHNDQLLPPPIKSFQHQVEQLKKNTYSCPDCGKLFSRAKALQFHMKSHGYETGHSPSSPGASATLEDLQCATCLSHFNNKASLRAHQKLCIRRVNQAVDSKPQPLENDTIFHKENVVTQKGYEHLTLSTEGKEEMNSTEFKIEDQSHNSDLKYKCNKCDKSFSVVGALNLHQRIHAERYRLAKAKLAMSVMLKKPSQEELGKGPFHCSECGRRFMSNSALGSHKRWHKGKKFSRSVVKDEDFKSKTEGGAFQCNTCRKQFFNHCVLQRHQMFNPQCQIKTEPGLSKHTESTSTVENSDLSCPKCNKSFVEGFRLAVHCENEHGIVLEAADYEGDGLVLGDPILERDNVGLNGSESTSLRLKEKVHKCSLCSMTFAKERGLNAHIRQAHSDSTKSQNIVRLSPKSQTIPTSSEVRSTEAMSAVDYSTKKRSPVGKETETIISCLDCGTQYSSSRSLFDHKKVCMSVKQEFKQEIQASEGPTDVSPPPNRFSEHSVKCFYKCDMCGKAFQTEEHLRTHKTKAKSRPYCCALCCHGFWTETQLQQHLAWHDEVRGRLPNEVRYRLSAAMTSKSPKPKVPSADNREKFFPSTTLNDAMLKPDSQSSHKCQHCGKAFLSPTALQKHETQHCNNDSYHCSICPRTFSEIQDLIDHHQECIGDYNGQ